MHTWFYVQLDQKIMDGLYYLSPNTTRKALGVMEWYALTYVGYLLYLPP